MKVYLSRLIKGLGVLGFSSVSFGLQHGRKSGMQGNSRKGWDASERISDEHSRIFGWAGAKLVQRSADVALRVFRASGKLRAEGLGLRASAYDVEVFTCPNMVQVQSGCQVHSARASAACTSQIFGRAMNTITERLFARSSS